MQEDGARKLVIPSARDRLSALKLLGDIGMGAPVTMADIRERLKQQAVVLRQVLAPDQAEIALKALSGVWR